MIKKYGFGLFRDSMWARVLTVSVILFFVYLGDAILSDWVPSFLQVALGGSLFMGLVFSFSSVVGFVTDLIFPQLLRKFKARRLILLAIAANLIFSGILIWTTTWPWLVLFLLAMAVWGVYYELLWFGSAQFVSDNVPAESRSGVWGVLSVFKSLAYFIGPIVGSWLAISRGNMTTVVVAAAVVCLGYVIWVLTSKKERVHEQEIEPMEKFDIREELGYWKVLFVHVWPVLLISLTMGLIDATYWTTGAVLSDIMARDGLLGGLFLPAYMLPPIFMGVILAKWGVYKGKKKIAEIFLLFAGVFLTLLGLRDGLWSMLLLSFLTGVTLSVAWPMVDAVYSDILARMGTERKHMVGLSSSTTSLAYIIGPITAGFISSRVGERMTFVAMGVLTVVVAIVLLFSTPRKLRLPQAEMSEWKD
ncbi:MAG: MFS transporter [Microgenomates group bacterium]